MDTVSSALDSVLLCLSNVDNMIEARYPDFL